MAAKANRIGAYGEYAWSNGATFTLSTRRATAGGKPHVKYAIRSSVGWSATPRAVKVSVKKSPRTGTSTWTIS